jgi:hypothetical protein
MHKEFGKIQDVKFGIGGYQDSSLGIHLTFGSNSWGVGFSKSTWDSEIVKWTESSLWTEEDRTNDYADIMRYVSKLLSQAKVNSVDKLKNIPVELTFEGSVLKEWRILTEVL